MCNISNEDFSIPRHYGAIRGICCDFQLACDRRTPCDMWHVKKERGGGETDQIVTNEFAVVCVRLQNYYKIHKK